RSRLLPEHVHGHDVLDHGVAQHLRRGAPGLLEHLLGDLALDLELEALALPHRREPGEAEPRQRTGDRLALGVQDLRFRHDLDDHCGHGWQLLTDGTWAGPSLSARATRSVPRRPGARPAAVRRASGREGAPGQPLVGLDVARTGALD